MQLDDRCIYFAKSLRASAGRSNDLQVRTTCEALKKQNTTLANERDTEVAQHKETQKQLSELQKDKAKLVVEKANLVHEKDNINNEVMRLRCDNIMLKRENGELVKERHVSL